MRRPSAIQQEALQMSTLEDLTGVFESLASTQVAKVKGKVELSKEFFRLLWARYSSIRVDPATRITNREAGDGRSDNVFVIISAEAGLSGNIDQRLIETMIVDYNPKTTDIIVLGTHGANQLQQRGIAFSRYFQVPPTDKYIDVSPVIAAIMPYSGVTVYYEEYISLGDQGIKKIDLISTMKEMSGDDGEPAVAIEDTIFEPSLDEIADQMEVTMMTLTLSQTILESSLAQAASRFNAMIVAKKRAGELLGDYMLEYHRAKRSESDRSLREVMTTLKKKQRMKGAR
ncbi:F0F1 ATP synthase subunit gamma [Candidatus Saccharibacteria bacterium]|nr:F0F1 ATP synthase subunit gamma [Candidatus Saccharibacteria bacterium]